METKRAKLFRNGGSQAVRLPKGFRFPPGQREVLARMEDGRVILEAVDEWSDELRQCLGSWSEDIPRPNAPQVADLRNVFD